VHGTAQPSDTVGVRRGGGALRTPVAWGAVWGCLQAASPLAFFWLDAATVYALGLALIAAVYIGFAVADGAPGSSPSRSPSPRSSSSSPRPG
jgi:hypothetical protein